MKVKVIRFDLVYIVPTSFLFLVVRPLLLVAMPFAPSSVLCSYLGSQKVCRVGMALSSPKFYHQVAHTRYATTLEWFLPPLNVLSGDTVRQQ